MQGKFPNFCMPNQYQTKLHRWVSDCMGETSLKRGIQRGRSYFRCYSPSHPTPWSKVYPLIWTEYLDFTSVRLRPAFSSWRLMVLSSASHTMWLLFSRKGSGSDCSCFDDFAPFVVRMRDPVSVFMPSIYQGVIWLSLSYFSILLLVSGQHFLHGDS